MVDRRRNMNQIVVLLAIIILIFEAVNCFSLLNPHIFYSSKTAQPIYAAKDFRHYSTRITMSNLKTRKEFLLDGLMAGALSTFLVRLPAFAEVAERRVKCDPAVSHLQDPITGKEIFLIGTAHISNISAQLVQDTIRVVQPNAVMIELDEKRARKSKYAILADQVANSSMPTVQIAPVPPSPTVISSPQTIRDSALNSAAEVIGNQLGGMYQKLDKMGFQSGEEFAVAIREAKKINAEIVLGDRDVQVTLRRLTEALSQTDLKKLANFELPEEDSFLKGASLNDADSLRGTVELLKRRESIRPIIKSIAEVAPEIHRVMIKERDEVMANNLKQTAGKKIVAVVGMAHMDGIESNLGFKKVNTCYQ